MTDKEKYEQLMQRYKQLINSIIETEFNDIDFRQLFDNSDYDVLSELAFKCWFYSKRSKDITYAEQTQQISQTIMNKEQITYKQFRVLCFFYKRYDYRLKNPIKEIKEQLNTN